jgi:hypothetical protein
MRIHHHPQGPSKFVVKSCSMFNKDYEVYRDAVDVNNRWLFVNRSGKGMFDPTGYIDLENYVRINPEDKKKGQVLWKAKYNERPSFQMGMSLGADSEDDGDSNGMVQSLTGMFSRMANTGNHRFYSMKWRTFSEAKIRSVKTPGQEYSVKIKAKGYCTRTVNITYERDENGHRHRRVSVQDHEYVTKISYKIKQADGSTIERFDMYPGDGGYFSGPEMVWECGAFTAKLKGGFFSNYPHEIETKPGIDPGFALIFAHICVTEFAPDEIKKDLKPQWNLCPGYVNPY